jgi:hypothetical protein
MEISFSGFKKKTAFFSRAMKSTLCSRDNIQADDVKQRLTQKFQIRQQVFDKYRALHYGDTQLAPLPCWVRSETVRWRTLAAVCSVAIKISAYIITFSRSES